jgi:thermolabile hemolysin
MKQLSQQHSNLTLAMLDVNALYQRAITNPNTYRFTNVTQACFTGSRSCDRPEQFLFWDGIHPTTAAHQILGNAAFAAIQEAGMTQSRLATLP